MPPTLRVLSPIPARSHIGVTGPAFTPDMSPRRGRCQCSAAGVGGACEVAAERLGTGGDVIHTHVLLAGMRLIGVTGTVVQSRNPESGEARDVRPAVLGHRGPPDRGEE